MQYRLDLHVFMTSYKNVNLTLKCWTELDVEIRLLLDGKA